MNPQRSALIVRLRLLALATRHEIMLGARVFADLSQERARDTASLEAMTVALHLLETHHRELATRLGELFAPQHGAAVDDALAASLSRAFADAALAPSREAQGFLADAVARRSDAVRSRLDLFDGRSRVVLTIHDNAVRHLIVPALGALTHGLAEPLTRLDACYATLAGPPPGHADAFARGWPKRATGVSD